MKINSLSIFCGAHKGHDPIFEDEAIELVNLLAEYSIDIVYGGGNVGLMKVISDRAVELGINVTGITLKSLNEFEQSNPNISKTLIVDDLFERKKAFIELSDGFIVLPGGIGSMDELLEVVVTNQLGLINKPVGLLNTNNYYEGFLSWFKESVKAGFVSQANFDALIYENTPKKLLELLISKKLPDDNDWIKRLNINDR